MGRVLANNVGLSFALQNAESVAGPHARDPGNETGINSRASILSGTFRRLEPNSLGAIGATISTIVRNPISASRQRKKGTLTDLDSSVEFEHDITYDALSDLLPGFMFAIGSMHDLQRMSVNVAAADLDGLGITAPAETTRAYVKANSLLWLYNFSATGNNGLKVVESDLADPWTTITLTEDLASGMGLASICGYRHSIANNAEIALNPTVVITRTNAIASAAISATGLGTALRERGLKPGQLIHIGSKDSLGADIQNILPSDTAARPIQGYARVRTIENDTLTLDKIPTSWSARAGAAAIGAAGGFIIDFIWGNYIKSVESTNNLYNESPHWFEVHHPDLDDAGDKDYIHSKGNYCNTLGFNLPLTDKGTMSLAYIGTDTESPAVIESNQHGTIVDPVLTEAYNTTNDIARLRAQRDAAGLTTDFKSMTLSINNNVSPEKVIGLLGARYMNTGEFTVSIETQVIFTSGRVLEAIRKNETVTMDFILANNDGVIGIDIPGMTFGGGGRDYPENESVLLNITADTFEDNLFKSSLSFNLIPVPL